MPDSDNQSDTMGRMRETAREMFQVGPPAEVDDDLVERVVLEGLRDLLGIREDDPRSLDELMDEARRRAEVA